MAEETTGSGQTSGTADQAGQTGSGTQAHTSQADSATTSHTLQSKDGKVWTLAEAIAKIDELNRESASHRTRATAAEQERDRLQAERDTLAAAQQDRAVRELAASEAEKQRARNPTAVAKLIALGDVRFDDKGKPTNLDKLIEQLRKDFPELFAAGSADGGTGNGSQAASQDMNRLIRRAAGREPT